MNYKSDKIINEDKNFFGFKLRTRRDYYDNKIIRQILDGNDPYRIPDKLNVVVDIGANIGCVSLLAASRGARVYAFEPESSNYETLVHNIKVNNLNDRVICVNEAVGISGTIKLYIHDKNSGATSSYLEQKGLSPDKYQEIKSVTIRDVFNRFDIQHCDLLKLDCEGSERDVIRDFDDDLAGRVKQISVEFHNKLLTSELVDKLKKWYHAENTNRHEWVFKKNL